MIFAVVGARPNFVKMAPVVLEGKKRGVDLAVVQVGQHFDAELSSIFMRELEIPEPYVYLKVENRFSQPNQVSHMMAKFEAACLEHSPDLVILSGDVNATLACALAASKLKIPIAHVEAGLRSYDYTMPEEGNRVITDHLAELLFTTEPSGESNLLREGISKKPVHLVGNTMIDSLKKHLE